MNTTMSPESMDNVDLDIVMFVENILDTHIPDDDAKHFGGPLGMEEWLEQHLSNRRPKEDTAELLRMLADAQQRPELAEVWTEHGGESRLVPLSATSSASEPLRWNSMKCFCCHRCNDSESTEGS
jgi:hypothetical protein